MRKRGRRIKREREILGPSEVRGGGEVVVRPYLGKCDSTTDPMTGTSINKWCVHVCGSVVDYFTRGTQNSVNTPRTRTNSEVTLSQFPPKNC